MNNQIVELRKVHVLETGTIELQYKTIADSKWHTVPIETLLLDEFVNQTHQKDG